MVSLLKRLSWMAWLMAVLPAAWGWSPVGPSAGYGTLPGGFGDAWETPDIGYYPSDVDGEAYGPKNLGEEYRRNTPVLYYTIDANFLDFFGSNGVYAVDQAFAVFNSLT